MTSTDAQAKAAAAVSRTVGTVNARKPAGDVGGVPGASVLAPDAAIRETRVTTCPGAMAGSSA